MLPHFIYFTLLGHEKDDLLEYANEQLDNEGNNSDDSDDPLDAFMAGIAVSISYNLKLR